MFGHFWTIYGQFMIGRSCAPWNHFTPGRGALIRGRRLKEGRRLYNPYNYQLFQTNYGVLISRTSLRLPPSPFYFRHFFKKYFEVTLCKSANYGVLISKEPHTPHRRFMSKVQSSHLEGAKYCTRTHHHVKIVKTSIHTLIII